MKQLNILKLLNTDTVVEFKAFMTDLMLNSKIDSYTFLETSGTLCKPVYSENGINEGIFELADFSYKNTIHVKTPQKISHGRKTYIIHEVFFCKKGEQVKFVILIHIPLSPRQSLFLKEASSYIGKRYYEVKANESRYKLFVDYDKKIDFIKSSSEILKSLTVKDVLINTLEYFHNTFKAGMAFAANRDFVHCMNFELGSLYKITVHEKNLGCIVSECNENIYLNQGIYSEGQNIKNLFIICDKIFKSKYVLLNVNSSSIPDSEFADMMSDIVSIAFENARNHERITRFRIEEAEMEQTVDILNRFVVNEITLNKTLDIFSANYPAKSTGGDYSAVIEEDEYILICVADVCGKGYSAAVFTVMLATVMESGLTNCDNLADMVKKLNKYLLRKNFDDRFITGFFCLYDKNNKALHYVSCGHEPAMLFGQLDTKLLTSNNLPMGIIDEEYVLRTIPVNSGELLFIYTDGVTEYLSHDKLMTAIKIKYNMQPKDIVKSLYKELIPTPSTQKDDFTCTAVRFT